MTAANYDACYDKTMQWEGGYQCDPNDSGNWTGCAVGAGINKGTNKGISACSYPDLDIETLSDGEIEAIYRRDFWPVVCGDDLPAGVDSCTFDGAVNSGPLNGVKWLQEALGMPAGHCDGVVGSETLGYVGKIDDVDAVIDDMCDRRLAFLKGLSTWPTYGVGWSNRVADIRASAHVMAAVLPVPPPAETTITVTITITVPTGAVAEVHTS
jgi:lysozyme family protein